ncbi:hypothetical protein COLO4_06134 [Corchorus olitorius]|uniref:Uncharacterized protein n=1 Tax=Corchorus olitorius TaxID=93759 RepID=A0A1R3KNT0_9ROSI|nr:hypothetical protein COLO4_06134 [Corchorus olitorius]
MEVVKAVVPDKRHGSMTEQVVDSSSNKVKDEDQDVHLSVQIPQKDMECLDRSAVGRLKNIVFYRVIQGRLTHQGICVNVCPLSNISVLLTIGSMEEMNTLLEEYSNMFSTWFEEVTPWTVAKAERVSHMWISVSIVNEDCVPILLLEFSSDSTMMEEALESPVFVIKKVNDVVEVGSQTGTGDILNDPVAFEAQFDGHNEKNSVDSEDELESYEQGHAGLRSGLSCELNWF